MGKTYLINEDSLTSIANVTRQLTGSIDKLTLDDIDAALQQEKTNVDLALEALEEKGVEIPENGNASSLPGLIQAIEGGSSLNFEVIGGTSEPINPKENTIWVNTSSEITGWTFDSNEPSNPQDGTVWILTTLSGSVKFNALKKQAISIYPSKAKQYVNGSWADKDGSIYQAGEWKEWVIYLFTVGDFCLDVTGGWTKFQYPGSGYNENYGTISEDFLQIAITNGSPGCCAIGTINKIDLTDVSKILFYFSEVKNSCYIGVRDNLTSSTSTDYAARLEVTEAGPAYLDVSALTGSYHVFIANFSYSQAGNGGTVTEIYLEE